MATQGNLLKPRWQKVFADLWENKLRTLLVVASIAVGVFAVGTIVTTYGFLSEDVGLTFAARNPANIDIHTDPFSDEFVRVINRLPGVLEAEGRRIVEVRVSNDGGNWKRIKLVGVEDFNQSSINLLKEMEGKRIPERRELVVSHDFLNSTGFQVGDRVEIELPDGSTRFLSLVGLVSDQATNGADFVGGANGFTTLDTLGWLGLGNSFNRLYVRVDGDSNSESAIQAVADRVEEKIESNNRRVYRTEIQGSNQHPMTSIVLAILGVMTALGGLILVLSGSLIINTLNALLSQHLRQIGVMKLVGGRSKQIMGMYLVLILAYGLAALVLALPLSGLAGYWLAELAVGFINAELLGFRVVPLSILLQILIALLIPLIAGFIPVNSGARTNVRRAISNDRLSAQTSNGRWSNRLSGWLQWLSRPVILSLRNTFRRKGRLLLTIFTLTMGGAIFIAVFNVHASMESFMDLVEKHFKADINLSFNHPYAISQVEKTLLPFPGIEHLEAWGAASVDILEEDDRVLGKFTIMAPPVNSRLVDADIVAGRWITPGEQKAVVVSDMIYDFYPALQPGDKVRIETPKGREQEWAVVGVFRFTDMMNDILAYGDQEFIADLLDIPNQAFNYRIITSHHSAASQQQVGRAVDEYLRDRGYLVSDIEVGSFTQEQSGKAINVLIVFLLIMALLTAVVGSIGLTGTMGMNVMERTREIGVMRAIGAVDGEIMKSVVIEGGFIGLITWVFAVILSFPISEVLLKIISQAMLGSPLRLVFTYQGFLIWLGAVLLLAAVASLVPARNAAKLTIREVLAYE